MHFIFYMLVTKMNDDIAILGIMVSLFVCLFCFRLFYFYYIMVCMTIQTCTFKGAVSAVDTDVLFMVNEGVTC